MIPYNILTLPYYIILKIRHFLYDRKIIDSYRPSIPSIGLGNITVGGTGKTPHCEMLVRIFMEEYRIAVISRGYGRKSRGTIEISAEDSSMTAGDEPLQIKRKFPDIRVIVSESRIKAVRMLESDTPEKRPQLIIFDDIFQHRKIIPSANILLSDYTRPFYKDTLLPFGRLRDIPSASHRADIFIVTKMPYDTIPDGKESAHIKKGLKAGNDRPVFFSSVKYGKPVPVFRSECEPRYAYSHLAIYFSAIADDRLFKLQLSSYYKLVGGLKFRDHRDFSARDIEKLGNLAAKYPEAIIVTTEKDSMRLLSKQLDPAIRKRFFIIPIEIGINYDSERECPSDELLELKTRITALLNK